MKKQAKKFIGIVIMMIASAALAAGCGDDEGPSIERGQFAQEYTDALCARAFDCCATEELQEVFSEIEVTTEEECRTAYAEVFGADAEAEFASVDAGRKTYHPDNAGECLEAFSSASCGGGLFSASASIPACDKMFTANVARGGECESDSECIEGRCAGVEYDQNFEVVALGACEPYREIGESCDFGDCVEGAYCEVEYDSETGEPSGTCLAKKANGEECVFSNECESRVCRAPIDGSSDQKICVRDTGENLMCTGN